MPPGIRGFGAVEKPAREDCNQDEGLREGNGITSLQGGEGIFSPSAHLRLCFLAGVSLSTVQGSVRRNGFVVLDLDNHHSDRRNNKVEGVQDQREEHEGRWGTQGSRVIPDLSTG